ncbi:TPA: CRISPR-associated endonuclease Cas2 [Candidatus Bathyarchaeota archaeon]|nr:CRISPR-associated endonuclease Cas2 [Candidatus Bathyarchaeota archaeon]
MRYVVIYDVSDDGLRAQVSELLKDYGLVRIQKSAFIGRLKRSRLRSLHTDLRKLVGDRRENVQLYPLCDSCYRGRRLVGVLKVDDEDRRRLVFV